jgi:hypothetical protein
LLEWRLLVFGGLLGKRQQHVRQQCFIRPAGVAHVLASVARVQASSMRNDGRDLFVDVVAVFHRTAIMHQHGVAV